MLAGIPDQKQQDRTQQRNGKPAEKQGRKVADLKGAGLRTKPVPNGS